MSTPNIRFFSCILLLAVAFSVSGSTGQSQVPMHMKMKMKDIKSTQDFINNMIKPRPPPGANLTPQEREMYSSTETGFNSQGVEIMASMIAVADVCEPRPMTVPIPPSNDPQVVYWPTCTKIDRCGGCCGFDLLECTATRVETVTVQVMKQVMSADDSEFYEFMGLVDIPLEKHTGCECQCRTKAHDCNAATQDYDEVSCSCRCRNSDQATSCPSPKRWDSKYCRCVCPTLINCLDDEYFDFNSCSCKKGSPVVASNANALSANPCATQTCRSGLRPVVIGNTCQCRRSGRARTRV